MQMLGAWRGWRANVSSSSSSSTPQCCCPRRPSATLPLPLPLRRRTTAVAARASDADGDGGASRGSSDSTDRPARRGLRRRRRQVRRSPVPSSSSRAQQQQQQRESVPQEDGADEWPAGLLPDGGDEWRAAMELFDAMGPAERARLGAMARGELAAEFAAMLVGEGPEELTRRYGADVLEDPAAMRAAAAHAQLWAALRGRLSEAEAGALDKLFGADWGAALAAVDDDDGGGNGGDNGGPDAADLEARFAELAPAEKLAAVGAIAKIEELRATVASVDAYADAAEEELEAWQRAQQRQDAAGDSGSSSGGDGGGGGGDSSGGSSEPYPGASPAMRAALEVLQGGETVRVDPEAEEARRRLWQAERDEAARRERRRREEEEAAAAGTSGGGGSGGVWGMDERLDR